MQRTTPTYTTRRVDRRLFGAVLALVALFATALVTVPSATAAKAQPT
jgi:hypothetical protein